METWDISASCALTLAPGLTVQVDFTDILEVAVSDDGKLLVVTGFTQGNQTTDFLQAFADGVKLTDPIPLNGISRQVTLVEEELGS